MKHIPVYYTPKQISCPATESPSPRKPAWVVADWQIRKLPIEVHEPLPLNIDQISIAHDRAYVEGVMACRLPNGFRGRQPDVAQSLLWTTGSFLSAARAAIGNGKVACSPTSGFHHARYCSGFGYCTFNGLMIAALQLKKEGKVHRVGILDCDQHYGDGTAEIIDKLGIDWIKHYSKDYQLAAFGPELIYELPAIVQSFAGVDLLFYQAGADQHINDPLGGFLTTNQLRKRDEIVFSEAKQLGIPVVWNLAGGYQKNHERVVEIHRNTMAACVSEYFQT
jgi:acetoin utilization deacetylase AcuC-like enzyme